MMHIIYLYRQVYTRFNFKPSYNTIMLLNLSYVRQYHVLLFILVTAIMSTKTSAAIGTKLPKWLPRMSLEKQDTLLKFIILALAAVLCEWLILFLCLCAVGLSLFCCSCYCSCLISCVIMFQHLARGCFPSWDLKALFTSSIPILIIAQRDSSRKRDSMIFITGSMIEPGILWVVSSVVQYIQVIISP